MEKWRRENLVVASDGNVAEAQKWLEELRPGGSSSLLHALKVMLALK